MREFARVRELYRRTAASTVQEVDAMTTIATIWLVDDIPYTLGAPSRVEVLPGNTRSDSIEGGARYAGTEEPNKTT